MKALIALATLAVLASPGAALAGGFKVSSIHFETNASACDMGIQVKFDTEGITEGEVTGPDGARVYSFESENGMEQIGGQTEWFLEGVEPQITELMTALGCERSDEPIASLDDMFDAFPAGQYEFAGKRKHSSGVVLRSRGRLSHRIPAGPVITVPSFGAVVADHLTIRWRPVSGPIIPELGPVEIVGYHVIVEEAGTESPLEIEADVFAGSASFTIPRQFLRPGTKYNLEVLSVEAGGNQTITEGFFCTAGTAKCTPPE